MTRYSRTSFVISVLTALLALVACGQAGPAPIALDVRPDVSFSNGDPQVRQAYVVAAISHANEFFANGGSLRVELFSGSPHGITLIDSELPPGLSNVERARQVLPMKAEIQRGLEEALGLRRPRPEIAQAIGNLARGSDVVGNLAEGIASVRSEENAEVVVLTDGQDSRFRSAGPSVGEMLDAIRPLLPRDADGISVSILGVGGTRGGGASAERTQRLLAVWRRACSLTGADCFVSSEIDGKQGGS